MSGIIAPAPIRKSIHVNVAPARAFDVFTAGAGNWWLKSHSINATKSPIKDVIIEPRAGGRWFERGEDGSECNWGKVLAWEPPTRLLLAWQINSDFKYDPALVTEVEIRFTPADSGTLVELEHRLIERMGARGVGMVEAFTRGWGLLIDSYAQHANGGGQ
ncbi:MAG TPA: SRPBCC family protein [Stellaceae bacterium]|nr:SRPBCC family protein [Stellaceae bacterium]